MQSGTPILYATLGEIFTEKSGVLNLGVEGVMIVGALTAFVIALTTGSPVLAFVAAGLAGALAPRDSRRGLPLVQGQPGGLRAWP